MTEIRIDAEPRKALAAAGAFAATIFLSACLLFSVQPLFTKIVLPAIGGAPAVWTTAMLFFQSVLIAGYLYAHLVVRHLPQPMQMALHLAIWALALAFLPLALPQDFAYDAEGDIALQTLLLYALGVGVPFAVLSANAPLLQSWYRQSGGPKAEDPYFLYGASNLGSLLSLLAFPLLAEPFLTASQTGWIWAGGFVLFGPALALCGLLALQGHRQAAPSRRAGASRPAMRPATPLTARQIGFWLLLALIPSSLMLAVTTKITTDVGSFPLVWVIPLALYLASFVLSFTESPWLGDQRLQQLMRLCLALLVMLAAGSNLAHESLAAAALLILAGFGLMWAVHRRLYLARPGAEHLTAFYLIMSLGGALGGLFNSLLAPLLFDGFLELSVTLAACIALIWVPGAAHPGTSLLRGLILGAACVLPLLLGKGILAALPLPLLGAVCAAALAALLQRYQGQGSLQAGALIAALGLQFLMPSPPVHLTDRSFFGPHEVKDVDGIRYYMNGTTAHGAQRLADLEAPRPTPISYYAPQGPMGQILTSPRARAAGRIGIVGLGVGSLACYRQPGQDWHFYEIDQTVDRIARNPALFTFMSSCAGDAPTHLGDARIVLARQADLRFDILVIDAYSSDSVPLHLSTTEALSLYRDRLAPGGLLVLHVSNRFYQIDRALARGAAALGMPALVQTHTDVDPARRPEDAGVKPSQVVVMAADAADLADLAADPRWQELQSDGARPWSDDYAYLLSVLR